MSFHLPRRGRPAGRDPPGGRRGGAEMRITKGAIVRYPMIFAFMAIIVLLGFLLIMNLAAVIIRKRMERKW